MGRDDGAPPPGHPPSDRDCCAKRMWHGGWCILNDLHQGDCAGPPRPYGPWEPTESKFEKGKKNGG